MEKFKDGELRWRTVWTCADRAIIETSAKKCWWGEAAGRGGKKEAHEEFSRWKMPLVTIRASVTPYTHVYVWKSTGDCTQYRQMKIVGLVLVCKIKKNWNLKREPQKEFIYNLLRKSFRFNNFYSNFSSLSPSIDSCQFWCLLLWTSHVVK